MTDQKILVRERRSPLKQYRYFFYSVGIQYLEAIRRLKGAKYEPKRTIHCLFVPDEEIGSARGMKKLIKIEEFKALNIGFVLDEGTMKINKIYIFFFYQV
jgi:hypothetical protein